QRYEVPPGDQNSEPVFVPRPGAQSEDDGWVLVCVYRQEGDRSIDTHISSLRRKLQLDQAGDAPAIRNLRGLGYVLAGAA
ncbi:helix-turn-helix domain-containing protein, partial [Achromobacter xylosoxidans]|uniref:helix-turn-helix domain-containing protein n=1 Tax=Alcaligenes xylosoxydans xylosoxydans TaxID=85698 RepID=UPI001F10043D